MTGVQTCALPIFFSTAVTVAAFVPLFTMQGVEGQIFNPMARTYGYALVGALLATFTVTPVLAAYLLPEHLDESDTLVVLALRHTYTPVLRWSLQHRKTMAVSAAACLGLFALIMPRLGTEFLPALKRATSGSAPPCRRRYRSKPACPSSRGFAKSS